MTDWIGLDISRALEEAEAERKFIIKFWLLTLVIALVVGCSTVCFFDARFPEAQSPGVVNTER